MNDWLHQSIQLLPAGNSYYFLLLAIAFIESLPIFGLLMPGSTLIVLAGFLAFQGKGLYFPIMLLTASGALLGDLLSFWLGSHFGSKLLLTRSFRKHRMLVKQSETFFCSHGGKSVFFARFLGPIRGITPFIAGLSNMPAKLFSIYAVISAALWGIVYPGLGYLGGASWEQAQSMTARFGLLVLLALAITIIHYWLRRSLKSSGEK
ncbi:membrane protein DedA, SNARE-associated domain [Malonomonas rubra DSM 5091]|uniref:Membrane protein DedA, SNARE-associated domain n=1 Tax=Malonomonas rubra DSM 5091 TaxID=1122189 RepID=A0A1M6BM45_MALRU|nr:DedA family protein [Malonomonas rubra]SHI49809.1 membrane protein DedA, SNARE-associated domain [Malonomonas rubra DSM 5091]